LGLSLPIYEWDDLARYAAWGSMIYSRGSISPQIYSYPLLVPLLYTYGFLVSGFRNDYLIKIIPIIFGLLTLALTYLVSSEIITKKKPYPIISVFFVLCFVPFFDWFHLGYVDIPAAFYFVGTFYVFYNSIKNLKRTNYWLLTGIFLGLALWSKQQTITAVFSFLLASFVVYKSNKKAYLDTVYKISLSNTLYTLFVAFLIAAPWYIRDYLIVGSPLQIPILESDPTINNLFLFVNNWQNVGYFASTFFQFSLYFFPFLLFVPATTGITVDKKYIKIISLILLMLGLFTGVYQYYIYHLTVPLTARLLIVWGIFIFIYGSLFFKKTIFILHSPILFILIWFLPLYLIWWLRYTTIFRYLITLIPFFSLIFVFTLEHFLSNLQIKRYTNLVTLFVIILVTGFAIPHFGGLLMGHDLTHIFENPATKEKLYYGDIVDAAAYLQHNAPPDAKIVSTDNRLAYFSPLQNYFNITPAYLSDLIHFDYYVLNIYTLEAYQIRKNNNLEVYNNLINKNTSVFDEVYTTKNYTIYKIKVTQSDFTPNDSIINDIITNQSTVNSQKEITQIGTVYLPVVLPGMWNYKLKILNDNKSLFLDHIFYNGAKTINNIASKRLLEAYSVCIKSNRCELAKQPLNDFRSVFDRIINNSTNNNYLLDDGTYYLIADLRSDLNQWGIILAKLAATNSSITSLSQEIIKNDFLPSITRLTDITSRKEPVFGYYNNNNIWVEK